jgi:hypothetical protein
MLRGRPLLNSEFYEADLRQLTYCIAALTDVLTLCRQTKVENLTELHMEICSPINSDLEEEICSCLKCIGKNLSVCSIDGKNFLHQIGLRRWQDVTLSKASYKRIFDACPNLVRLNSIISPMLVQVSILSRYCQL